MRTLITLLLGTALHAQTILALTYPSNQAPAPYVSVMWAYDSTQTYTVSRSSVSGGPYAALATSPFAFANNCGDGCYWDFTAAWAGTYYYVVSTATTQGPELAVTLPFSRFDLNQDGVVNIADLLLLVAAILGP